MTKFFNLHYQKTRRGFSRLKRQLSTLKFFAIMAVLLAFPLAVFADNLIVDGDGLVPVGSNQMNLGSICQGQSKSSNALLAIQRTGGGALQNVFSNSNAVTVTAGTPSSADVSAAFLDSGIALPGNWTSAANNTMSSDTATSQVTAVANGSAGAKTATIVYTANGTRASDGSALSRSATLTVNWTVDLCDTTPPVIMANVAGTLGNNGWYTSDVEVSWNVTDPESAFSSNGCDTVTIDTDTNGQTLTCSASSPGGENEQSVTIMRDATAPTIAAAASPAPNAHGWNNTNVTVSYTCADNLSGVASCEADQTLMSEGSNQTASGMVVDQAGNNASAMVTGINIDKTAPTLAPTVAPNPVVLGGSATASPNASDALSGVDTASCGIPNTSTVGAKSVSCTATDLAGNNASANAAFNVVFNWAGFFRPVDNLPTVNVVKAGSAIPLKFSLAGDQGLSIFAAGYPKSQKITCDNSAPMDTIEETVAAVSNNLSYDAITDQYNYVWKSDKAWAGTCRQLTVMLIDGTTYVANFKFNK